MEFLSLPLRVPGNILGVIKQEGEISFRPRKTQVK